MNHIRLYPQLSHQEEICIRVRNLLIRVRSIARKLNPNVGAMLDLVYDLDKMAVYTKNDFKKLYYLTTMYFENKPISIVKSLVKSNIYDKQSMVDVIDENRHGLCTYNFNELFDFLDKGAYKYLFGSIQLNDIISILSPDILSCDEVSFDELMDLLMFILDTLEYGKKLIENEILGKADFNEATIYDNIKPYILTE